MYFRESRDGHVEKERNGGASALTLAAIPRTNGCAIGMVKCWVLL